METRLIRRMVREGGRGVCAGGGGVPVIRDEHGRLAGVEAVVDKDLTASMLAEALDCDALLILTDVPRVDARLRHAAGRARSPTPPRTNCAP